MRRRRNELVISVSTIKGDHYSFAVSSGKEHFENVISQRLSASVREDLRLLRWKAVGLHDPGDSHLVNVGRRLSDLVFPPDGHSEWAKLLRVPPCYVRIRFGSQTEDLLHLPWELLHLEGRFVLQELGSHVIRELPSVKQTTIDRRDFGLLHVSLGVDPGLRLDEERCILLDVIPRGNSMTFVLNPTTDELELVLAELKPMAVVISGHGRYDDLDETHAMESLEGLIQTEGLIALAGRYDCSLLLLWSCESARIGSTALWTGGQGTKPVDVISFTYPVRSTTALSSVRVFLESMIKGHPTDEALALVRAAENEDIYSFFNIVHYHLADHPFFRIPQTKVATNESSAARCNGQEKELLAIDKAARESPVTTVLAPVGSEATSLLAHWCCLNSRSPFGRCLLLEAAAGPVTINSISADIRWLAFNDPDGRVALDSSARQIVRYVSPKSYNAYPNERVIQVTGIEETAAMELAQRILGTRIHQVIGHPLCAIPSFLERVAAGNSCEEATSCFEIQNDMPSRHGRLGSNGRLLASLLFTMRGTMANPEGDETAYPQHMNKLGIDTKVILAGIDECVNARVAFRFGNDLCLSPDFLLLGDKWFPNWRREHISIFKTMLNAFASLDYHGKLDVDLGQTLLGWAVAIEAWNEACVICLRLCEWYSQQGRLEELEGIIRIILPNIQGKEHLILEGHLASILTLSGRYGDALALHVTVEQKVRRVLRNDNDYSRNLTATLSQQVDCLMRMGRLDEALQRWQKTSRVVRKWSNADIDVQPRLLAQRAYLCRLGRPRFSTKQDDRGHRDRG